MKKSKEKSPWLGCITYLILVTPAYFLTSWQVATSIAVLITVLMVMYGGIVHEIKKMRKLKNTPRTLINRAPKYGYIKLKVKVKPTFPNTTALLTNEAADYRWVSFQYAYTVEKTNSDGTTGYSSGWTSFYDDETNLKTLEIFDGTGSTYLALHKAHYYINFKEKDFTAHELLNFIKENNLHDVPLDEIKEDKKIKVVERWIRKDQPFTVYGTMNKLSLDSVPTDLIATAKKALKYGPDDDTRKRDRERILHEEDWLNLIEQAKKDGASTLDILTNDYTNAAENELILNVKDNKALNVNNYISIGVYLFGMGIVILIWYGFVNSNFPEFFEQF